MNAPGYIWPLLAVVLVLAIIWFTRAVGVC